MSPEPSLRHIADDPVSFRDSLRRFHFEMGSRFKIPVISGKELDLHGLYVEVTKRGGFERVVAEKKWRQVACALGLSPTATSASYVLRKHYFTLLYRYEQLHLFGDEVAPPLSDGVGIVDGKFECGYMVSVRVGLEILRGVLYHPTVPESTYAIVPYTSEPAHHGGRRKKRRERDPNHPKPNRSGYTFYFAEEHSKLKSLYPNRERGELTKMIGESWTGLGPDEKMVYQAIGLKDKERYQRELKEYNENLKAY